MSDFINLSYCLSADLTAYGNGERFSADFVKSISSGDSSNNSFLRFSAHLGTHIDFPFHFCNDGKKSSDYFLKDFIFNNIAIIEVDVDDNNIIINDGLKIKCQNIPENINFLLIKTGYSDFREKEKYWNCNLGFHPSLAAFLKSKFPLLRSIGFDSISLSSYKYRELGREAHKEFLCKHNILIIEDMDLSGVDSKSQIKQIFAVPLLIKELDASPVNVIAEIING